MFDWFLRKKVPDGEIPAGGKVRWGRVVVIGLVLVGLVAFCGPKARAEGPPPPPVIQAYPASTGYGTSGDILTAEVIVVGDSISNACRVEIRAALTKAGVTSAVNYWSGRPTKQGVSWALSLTRKPPVFVMELGSNDWADPSVMTSEIARLKAGLPQGTKVVWVDTFNSNKLLATGWTNQQIWASGLRVAPWYYLFAKAPWRASYYLRDGLHPKEKVGCTFLADSIDNTIVEAAA